MEQLNFVNSLGTSFDYIVIIKLWGVPSETEVDIWKI